jgi:hypothetical protein
MWWPSYEKMIFYRSANIENFIREKKDYIETFINSLPQFDMNKYEVTKIIRKYEAGCSAGQIKVCFVKEKETSKEYVLKRSLEYMYRHYTEIKSTKYTRSTPIVKK